MTIRLRQLTVREERLLGRISLLPRINVPIRLDGKLMSPHMGNRLRERAEIILLAQLGYDAKEIAVNKNISPKTVRTWIKRYNLHGIEALIDRPRKGRPATYTDHEIATILLVRHENPDWSTGELLLYAKNTLGIDIKKSRLYEIINARSN